MRIAILPLTIFALAACDRDNVKPDLPNQCAVAPEVQVVEKKVYVSISPELTREEPIAEGPIAQCFDVAAQRRAAIERLNSRARQVSEIEGTEVEP